MDGKRSRGRPKQSWIESVDADATVLGINNWRKESKDSQVQTYFKRGNRPSCAPAKEVSCKRKIRIPAKI